MVPTCMVPSSTAKPPNQTMERAMRFMSSMIAGMSRLMERLVNSWVSLSSALASSKRSSS